MLENSYVLTALKIQTDHRSITYFSLIDFCDDKNITHRILMPKIPINCICLCCKLGSLSSDITSNHRKTVVNIVAFVNRF